MEVVFHDLLSSHSDTCAEMGNESSHHDGQEVSPDGRKLYEASMHGLDVEVSALLDKGIKWDDYKDEVRIPPHPHLTWPTSCRGP